jgi:hypothetical protein
MFFKKFIWGLVITFCIFLFGPDPLLGQMTLISKFQKVNIPVNLILDNVTIEAGVYDLEILIQNETQVFFLRIIKGSKNLAVVRGERLEYKTKAMESFADPNIPEKATLKMTRNTEEKILSLQFESGKKASFYPFLKLRFKMKYE